MPPVRHTDVNGLYEDRTHSKCRENQGMANKLYVLVAGDLNGRINESSSLD